MEREPSSFRWDSNVWIWVLRDCDHWQIAFQVTDPFSHQRERPKTKNKATVRQKKGKRKIWSWAPKGCPTPRQIGRMTVGHINSTQWIFLNLFLLFLWNLSLHSSFNFNRNTWNLCMNHFLTFHMEVVRENWFQYMILTWHFGTRSNMTHWIFNIRAEACSWVFTHIANRLASQKPFTYLLQSF
jgi:hypothetical protein